jgi:hypothetical protein
MLSKNYDPARYQRYKKVAKNIESCLEKLGEPNTEVMHETFISLRKGKQDYNKESFDALYSELTTYLNKFKENYQQDEKKGKVKEQVKHTQLEFKF